MTRFVHKLLVALFFALVLPTVLSAGEQGGDYFMRERSLVAAFRCDNLKKFDGDLQAFFQALNPDTTINHPVLSLLAKNIFNTGLDAINTDSWLEVVYFTQPQEKDNDWVYVLHTTGEQDFIKALQGIGNIRREANEDGITRFRQTAEDFFFTFFVAFTSRDLIIISRNRSAIDKARKLYAFSANIGLLSDSNSRSDFRFSFHFSRFLLSNPRFISGLTEDVRRDVLRDLAGSQAKLDNPLNLGLITGLESIADILREMAVVDLLGNIGEDNLDLKIAAVTRYGGSLHYAISNMPKRSPSLIYQLPQRAEVFSFYQLWPEQYGSFLSGFGAAVQAAFGRKVSTAGQNSALDFLKKLRKSAPQEIATCIVDSPDNSPRFGPIFLSMVKFADPVQLSSLFSSLKELLTIGNISELLAEKGIKIDFITLSNNGTIGTLPVWGLEISGRSMYFELPETIGGPQRYLAVVKGDTLIMALPSAPLTQEQYREAEPFMLNILRETVAGIEAKKTLGTSKKSSEKIQNFGDSTIFYSAFNPLRYLQLSMKSQKVWPQPTPPNLLPIPWDSFSDEFDKFISTAKPVTLELNHTDEAIILKATLPVKAIKEFIGSILDFSPPVLSK